MWQVLELIQKVLYKLEKQDTKLEQIMAQNTSIYMKIHDMIVLVQQQQATLAASIESADAAVIASVQGVAAALATQTTALAIIQANLDADGKLLQELVANAPMAGQVSKIKFLFRSQI